MPEINTDQHYVEQQAKFKCNVGDTVRVSHSCESHANGWPNSWINDMDFYIGKHGIVLGIYDYGIQIKFTIDNESRFTFPYFVLNLVR
jgi:hypothetical protein